MLNEAEREGLKKVLYSLSREYKNGNITDYEVKLNDNGLDIKVSVPAPQDIVVINLEVSREKVKQNES